VKQVRASSGPRRIPPISPVYKYNGIPLPCKTQNNAALLKVILILEHCLQNKAFERFMFIAKQMCYLGQYFLLPLDVLTRFIKDGNTPGCLKEKM